MCYLEKKEKPFLHLLWCCQNKLLPYLLLFSPSWGRRCDRWRRVCTQGGSSKFYWQLKAKIWVITNRNILCVENTPNFSFKESSDYSMVQKWDSWAVLGLRVAGPRWVSDLLSTPSRFRLPIPRVRQIICNLALAAFGRIFLRAAVIKDHGNQVQTHQSGKQLWKLLCVWQSLI